MIIYEVPVLLGYDAAALDNWFPAFLDISSLEDKTTMLSGNIRNQSPSDTASSQNNGHFIYTTAKCNNLHDNL
jgi:hypothetical protein